MNVFGSTKTVLVAGNSRTQLHNSNQYRVAGSGRCD